MQKMRIDKWLWCVRLYKSRTQATDACKNGKVILGGQQVKPSSMVTANTIIQIKKSGFNFEYKILSTLKSRVNGTLALEYYVNLTPESELNKYNAWYSATNAKIWREKGAGRPTKKERREMDEFNLLSEEE